MKYKHGFLKVCVCTCFVVFLFALWGTNPKQDYRSLAVSDDVKRVDKRLLNFTEFKFLLNSNACDKADTVFQNVTTVQIVTSFAGNIEARNALRRAYSRAELLKLGVVRVFLLAALKPRQSEVTQDDLQNESNTYSDLVQGNFYESYRNLTYKHIMGLKYMYNLNSLINVKEKIGFELMGYIFKNKRPIRNKTNKWYTTKQEFSESVYPKFLSGWLYVTTPRVVNKLLSIAHLAPFFWIDDLFVTGILAKKLGISHSSINEHFSYHPELFECCIRDGVECEFSVGPNGGDHSLQISYQRHAYKCYIKQCKKLPYGRTVEQMCVAQRKPPAVGKGIPHFKVIRL
ncbi:hypothetical protein AAG570_008694 [Ranatra chinensis]|uniref:Hexosyltransferase n=1 Tax=Ranatra chinensis TaxID=642074 RepID=A0ABD0YRP4_9HEMI